MSRRNGHSQAAAAPELSAEEMHEAATIEAAIAAEAEKLRDDATELDAALFLKLYPLLRRPIPGAYIKTVGQVTGKPYASTGVSSVQVQIDRMNNVLTPLWWHYETVYNDDGTVAQVAVHVHVQGHPVVFSSAGGVDRGSTKGNVFKGSYTNAAKVAFARLGPGHEVYLGATDFDPDGDPEAAKQQEAKATTSASAPTHDGKAVGEKKGAELADVTWTLGLDDKLPLALMHVTNEDPGDVSTKEKAAAAIAALTQVGAARLERWLSQKADAQAAAEEASSHA